MIDKDRFKPKTVYVTYIAATPEKVWQALTDPAFTRAYFSGFAVDVEPKTGGAFGCWRRTAAFTSKARSSNGGRRTACPAPGRSSGCRDSANCRPALVTYDVEQAGEAVRLVMTERS